MRFSTFVAAAGIMVSLPLTPARAQTTDTTGVPTLTLDQAVALAIRNNPDYLTVVDQRSPAAARVRSAYGAFVPSAGVNFTGGYRGQGDQIVNGFSGVTTGSDILQSSYGIGLSYNLSVATFVNPSLQSANLRATDEEINSAATTLRSNVFDHYLLVLVDEANAVLQDSLVVSNQVQVDLARARLSAGSGTQLDLSKALVGLGNQKIATIRAHNATQVDLLSLYQTIGVPQPPRVRLTTRIPVIAPDFSLDSVLGLARAQNPALRALQERNSAAEKAVTSAKGNFFPTLNVQAGWGGYTNQYTNQAYPLSQANAQYQQSYADCAMTDSIRIGVGMAPYNCNDPAIVPPPDTAAIKAANSTWPFKFTKQPFQASATLSLPLFDGLSRLTQVQEARATSNDARYRVRAQELRLTADVTSAYLTLLAAVQAVDLSRENRAQAELALNLAQEKYRVGSATAVELSDARDSFQRAVSQQLSAIFEYHRAFAALERAVGRPLR